MPKTITATEHELFMGIMQNKLARLRGKQNQTALLMDQKDADKETLELKLKQYEQEYEAEELRLLTYENKVLKKYDF
jgi:hypothetical protein